MSRSQLFVVGKTVTLLAVAFLPQAAGAGPWRRHTIDDASRGADGVRLADVNGDGHPDIASGWEEGGVVRVYLNPGPEMAKERWPAVTVGRVEAPEDAVFADLDGDGAVDVVSACEGRTQTVFIHWAPMEPARYLDETAWKTQPIPATKGVTRWMYALPMEVDGRNGIDLIVASKDPGGLVGWLRSPADPRDLDGWKLQRLQDAGWIMSLEPADLDGDGDADLVVSDRKGGLRGVYWLENPGAEAAAEGKTWTRHAIGAANREVMFLCTVADPDRPRTAILAAIKPHRITMWEWPRNRDRAAGLTYEYPAEPYGTAKAVGAADLDRDGNLDLVVSCEHAAGERSGLFYVPGFDVSRHVDIGGSVGLKYDRIELLDLDGDGDLDVLTCEERDLNAVIWYENPAK